MTLAAPARRSRPPRAPGDGGGHKSPRLPRRRLPGESWNLWHVENPDWFWLGGYLITTRDRCPVPIAYVPPPKGADRRLPSDRRRERVRSIALLIRDGVERPGARGSIDLRGTRWWELVPDVVGRRLLPLDARGNKIGDRDRFACGQFLRGLRFSGCEDAPGFLLMAREFMRPQNKRSGTPAQPHTPTPASNEGAEARALTAA